MDTSDTNVRFGQRAGPDVERTLPVYLRSGKAPNPFLNYLNLRWTNNQKPTLSAW